MGEEPQPLMAVRRSVGLFEARNDRISNINPNLPPLPLRACRVWAGRSMQPGHRTSH